MMTISRKTFAEYVKENWLTIARDERGWYATHDFCWLKRQMAKQGWLIAATGKTALQPDDSVRIYFDVLTPNGVVSRGLGA